MKIVILTFSFKYISIATVEIKLAGPLTIIFHVVMVLHVHERITASMDDVKAVPSRAYYVSNARQTHVK
jgi:hypothetical protein